ncbi:hypothetical protein B0H13DRAFT_2291322 [Mycena leptocephala]|nr:hypothetical protein B0H13DRAFT_2291322 [Mycena leptocephala]
MSAHRNHSTKHALPNNPAYIDFPRTDGDSALWPTNTTREIDAEGCVNYMQPVTLDESICIKWRVGVGDAISVALKLPGGQPHVLRDFPNGYRMFDHHKGKADNPRHDIYLFGSDSRARFRSVPEFIPHAIWLMGDGSDVCKCKYCSKKPQREITSSMGNLLRNSHLPHHPALRDQNKTYAAVQKTPNLPQGVRPYPDEEQGTLPRWFRDGELVWCALQTPIAPPGSDSQESIRFWPAIIDEVKLRIDPKSPPPETSDRFSTPWVAQQSTAYKVQFLAISRSYLLPDSMIIPYPSYIVPNPILQAMVLRPVGDWDLSPDKLVNFDPCPPHPVPPPAFADTLTAFALALQIASTVFSFWCLTDEWDAKLTLPPVTRPAPPPSSLQSAIEFAGTNNAYVGSISSGPIPGRSQRSPPPRVVTQTRFQGLWWGGERIWADDLVRLKVPRNCLAPMGAQHIFAPSGPGNKSKLLAESRGADSSPYGAISRGVFMKIETIFIVDGVGQRECRVAGMLYELADSDWEDPNLPRNVDSISNGASSAGQSTKLAIPGSSGDFFALPPAPTGFKFRPILAPGYEVVLCLSLVSGRYYPRILQHPLMKPYLNEVIPLDPTTMLSAGHLWALEGLFGGYKNSVDPTIYKANREKMMSDASREAMLAIQEHVKERRSAAPMDLD